MCSGKGLGRAFEIGGEMGVLGSGPIAGLSVKGQALGGVLDPASSTIGGECRVLSVMHAPFSIMHAPIASLLLTHVPCVMHSTRIFLLHQCPQICTGQYFDYLTVPASLVP
jgi:hypothetical protein